VRLFNNKIKSSIFIYSIAMSKTQECPRRSTSEEDVEGKDENGSDSGNYGAFSVPP
jgi:hypothetical protein